MEYFVHANKLLPWQITWLHQICGKCYTYQYYTYHKWHYWLCTEQHFVPNDMTPLIVGTGLHIHLLLWDIDTSCAPLYLCPPGGWWPIAVGNLRKGLLEMEVRGFEQYLIPCLGTAGTCHCSYWGVADWPWYMVLPKSLLRHNSHYKQGAQTLVLCHYTFWKQSTSWQWKKPDLN